MMLATLFLTLVAKGVLANDMVARAMTQLDRVDGDIDTLMTRLAMSELGPTSRTVLTGQTTPSSGRIVPGQLKID